jgi:hypothetical protein
VPAVVLGVATFWVTRSPVPTPDQACLFALAAVVGLRLWTAGTFHPVEELPPLPRPRVVAAKPAGATAAAVWNWSGVWQLLPYVAAVVVLIVVVQAVLWVFL